MGPAFLRAVISPWCNVIILLQLQACLCQRPRQVLFPCSHTHKNTHTLVHHLIFFEWGRTAQYKTYSASSEIPGPDRMGAEYVWSVLDFCISSHYWIYFSIVPHVLLQALQAAFGRSNIWQSFFLQQVYKFSKIEENWFSEQNFLTDAIIMKRRCY